MNRMGRYGQALGVWHLTVGGSDLLLKPQMGDNYKLLRLLDASKKNKDSGEFLEKIGGFLVDLIKRDEPPKNDDELKELQFYVESNITELMKEMMLAFRLTTKDKLAELEKGDFAKNLIGET